MFIGGSGNHSHPIHRPLSAFCVASSKTNRPGSPVPVAAPSVRSTDAAILKWARVGGLNEESST